MDRVVVVEDVVDVVDVGEISDNQLQSLIHLTTDTIEIYFKIIRLDCL